MSITYLYKDSCYRSLKGPKFKGTMFNYLPYFPVNRIELKDLNAKQTHIKNHLDNNQIEAEHTTD